MGLKRAFRLSTFLVFTVVFACSSLATAEIVLPRFQERLEPASKYLSRGWDNQYSTFIERRIELYPELLNLPTKAVAPFCKTWSSLSQAERKKFWVHFLKSMAYAESGWARGEFTPETSRNLRRDSTTGLRVVSEGLMQISYGDARIYGREYRSEACQFPWNEQEKKNFIQELNYQKSTRSEISPSANSSPILHPLRNLACTLDILSVLYDKYKFRFNSGGFIKSGALYWATLRPGRRGYTQFVNEFKKEMTADNHLCGFNGKR